MGGDSLTWVNEVPRRRQVLETVMNKPRTVSEARELLKLGRGVRISRTFDAMVQKSILKTKIEKLYALTPKGFELRRKLLAERGEEFSYSEPHLDWKSYLWVIEGTHRRLFLTFLSKGPGTAAEILARVRTKGYAVRRETAYEILKAFASKSLAIIGEDHYRNRYRISLKGNRIWKQMLI